MYDLKERRRILESCNAHPTSGHLGINKTIQRINVYEQFMWPGIVQDVFKLVIITLYTNCKTKQKSTYR